MGLTALWQKEPRTVILTVLVIATLISFVIWPYLKKGEIQNTAPVAPQEELTKEVLKNFSGSKTDITPPVDPKILKLFSAPTPKTTQKQTIPKEILDSFSAPIK